MTMRFLVHGVDGDAFDFGENDRHEAHQAYMDAWSPQLIARGPTLSPDGEDHTGSIHVIEVDNADIAHGFAFREPYAQAGWYAEVTVFPLVPVVDGTMWDRPVPAAGQGSSFVRASWEPRSLEEVAPLRRALTETRPRWLFAGLILPDDLAGTTGFAGTLDLGPDEARDALAVLGDGASLDVQRWQRGGRSQAT